MKRYHLTILGHYDSPNIAYQRTIECDSMEYSSAGFYKFYKKQEQDSRYSDPIAYYPIKSTIITKIEELKK